MSSFYINNIQNLGSQKCCNIITQGPIGPEGAKGKEYIGPRGDTGATGISYTGPTGRGCKGPTGPVTLLNNIVETTEPYESYLFTHDFNEITNYLKININGLEKWIPLISKNPYNIFNSPLYNYPVNPIDGCGNTGVITIRWNYIDSAVGYKLYYSNDLKGDQYLINNNNISFPVNKYGVSSSYNEINVGNVLNYTFTLNPQSKYNIFIYAYDALGNRSETPTTQLYLYFSSSNIEYAIWPVYIYQFGNGASNMYDLIDNSLNTSVNVLNNYTKKSSIGIINYDNIESDIPLPFPQMDDTPIYSYTF
jgi:hypothetical protein